MLAHLLKLQIQPDERGRNWEITIVVQRSAIARRLGRMPGLQSDLADNGWISDVWDDAAVVVAQETGVTELPAKCPWLIADVINAEWMPHRV